MSVARRERIALVETLRAVGPEAPTLCAGWTTRDLAAHLVLREYRIDASPGITIASLAPYTARVQARIAESVEWDELVDRLAAGPPLYSPLKVLDGVANLAEMFVHHEDVLRATPGWSPRAIDDPTNAALRRQLRVVGRFAFRGIGAHVTMRTARNGRVASFGRGPAVTIVGQPGELVLFAFGRDQVRIELDGDPAGIAAVTEAARGI